MKILITTDLFRSTINGVVTSVLNLEEELGKMGHEVRILTVSDTGRAYREGNVLYLRSIPSGIYPGVRIPVSRGKGYVKALIRWKPDVVHSQCEFCTFGFGRRIARETGAVFIHTCHTLYEQYTKYIPIGRHLGNAALAGWMRFRLKGVDTLIVPTEKVEWILKSYGVENPIAVVPTGIRLEHFGTPLPEEELSGLREKCGIHPNAQIVLNLGRLGPEKRVDELLLGWKQADIPAEKAVLLIVGDGPARESLQKQCAEWRMEDRVRFFGMAAPWRVPAFYQMADLFVCASTSETQGVTYAEALASGLPLLCRADPCLEGVLEPGRNGYAYETVDELTAGLNRLLAMQNQPGKADSEWARMRAHSQLLAEKFSTKSFGEAAVRLYRKEIKKKEVLQHESAALCEESKAAFQKRYWTGYADAKRIP